MFRLDVGSRQLSVLHGVSGRALHELNGLSRAMVKCRVGADRIGGLGVGECGMGTDII